MRVYLIRHGQTTADIEGRYGGDYDDELTELGIEQANNLANSLANKNIEKIYYSPKKRAASTANILENKFKCDKEKIYNFKERNGYGVLTGLTKEEAKNNYPDEYENFNKYKYDYHIKGSEDYNDFRKRVINVFKEILDNKKYNTIAIVTHGGVIRAFIREVMNLGELEKLSDCAIIEFEYIENEINLLGLENAKLKKENSYAK